MEETAVLRSRGLPTSPARDRHRPSDERHPYVHTLTEFVLERRMRAALELLQSRLEGGVPIESLLRDYLAPTAQHLGSLWNEDRVTFTEVTVGVGRLQDLQRELDGHLAPVNLLPEAPRALLATVPGEQHAFGVSMAAALLHRRGWEVSGTPSNRDGDLLKAASQGWFEVIGLSLGAERNVPTIGPLVQRLRNASMNGNVRIVLGGRLATEQPELILDQLRDQESVEVAADVEALAGPACDAENQTR